jgi:hypothetical protein
MSRFYVHIKNGAELIRDEEGIDLPTPEHARAEALQAARELCVDAIKQGTETWGAVLGVFAVDQLSRLPALRCEAEVSRLRASAGVRDVFGNEAPDL